MTAGRCIAGPCRSETPHAVPVMLQLSRSTDPVHRPGLDDVGTRRITENDLRPGSSPARVPARHGSPEPGQGRLPGNIAVVRRAAVSAIDTETPMICGHSAPTVRGLAGRRIAAGSRLASPRSTSCQRSELIHGDRYHMTLVLVPWTRSCSHSLRQTRPGAGNIELLTAHSRRSVQLVLPTCRDLRMNAEDPRRYPMTESVRLPDEPTAIVRLDAAGSRPAQEDACACPGTGISPRSARSVGGVVHGGAGGVRRDRSGRAAGQDLRRHARPRHALPGAAGVAGGDARRSASSARSPRPPGGCSRCCRSVRSRSRRRCCSPSEP